ncbi:Lrp/AsnC family transcriptional regulator [Streptomyces yaizuensis]|uniref:Lrp/AsnC family transcriptional regulator n=1 Tax=Streptomyces yaizuensis TaxID=2989713 RepID=A0ABQ5NX27_9ACTN|nr:AsnC family transcriptional regulator [Streptomyces sp. YSPA8]GLF94906.1 Lrp/AsnC family transcriptional regulator [Streptomyces sp. YSPA8]
MDSGTQATPGRPSAPAVPKGGGGLDDLDHRLLHALQLDGRAPFSRVARALGTSEHTVARRYRRLRGLGLRVVGRPVPARLGLSRWLLRLRTAPDAAVPLAGALARRPDTSWITLAAGGTEIHCAVTVDGPEERDALLMRQLPRTPQVLSVEAHCVTRSFIGDTSTWHATRVTGAGAGADADLGAGAEAPPLPLTATDRVLLAELARDGRATLPELGAATGRAPSSVGRRLDRLRAEGALSFAVDFDPRHLGYHMSTLLWLRVAPARLRAVGEALATHPEIPFAAATTGPANLAAGGVFRTPGELYAYLDRRIGPLPGVQSVETSPTLREVKRLTVG